MRLRHAIVLASAAFIATALPWTRVQAEITNPGSYDKLRQETVVAVRGRVSNLLAQYCKDACLIVDIRVDIDEKISESEDIGFEGVAGDDLGANLYVAKIGVDIQVDDRVTALNRDRLYQILHNNLQNLGTVVDIVWKRVTVPQIGQSAAMEEQLKRGLQQRITATIEKVIDTYCPEQCVLSQVAIDGKLVTPDEASVVPASSLVRDRSGQGILRIEAVDVEVGMDSRLAPGERTRIANIMKARTRFVNPLNLDLQVTEFPESYAKQKDAAADPFGLAKLRETLRIFKELAGTKEIISTTRTSTSATSSENNQEAKAQTTSESASSQGELDPVIWALLIGGLLVVAGLITVLVLRFTAAQRDARLMMASLERPAHAVAGGGAGAAPEAAAGTLSDAQRREMALRVRNAEIKEELIKTFFEAPKVAKETFSRLLQEEGVEETARFVHIFGHLVIFELLGDPNLQRGLYELSEYYHKSDFNFTVEEEHALLTALKTRVTANEIRILARKQLDVFDFLTKLDATQIFNLISEEKPQVQSIVLTQLDHKRRRAVFEMYTGDNKVALMRELCRADAIPKEYLTNVAKALEKKVASRPEFDTEQLRSSDILLDLLEKADLNEQRALMQNLVNTNPEAARAIKLRLVTVEILPYLKDGHLLELILGLEREDLLAFLVGTREHIRALILSKAPDELADSWIEDLQHINRLDDQNYRLVEMKVLGRIRSLANNGLINLLDVNDMIFGKAAEDAAADDVVGVPSDSAMVA